MALSQVQLVLLLLASFFVLRSLAHDFQYCFGDDYYADVTSVEIARKTRYSPFFSIHLNATASKTITQTRAHIRCTYGIVIYYNNSYDICDMSKCNSNHEIEAGTNFQWTFPNIPETPNPMCTIYTENVDDYDPWQLCVNIEVGSLKHSSS